MRAKFLDFNKQNLVAAMVALLVMVEVSPGAAPPDEKSKSAAFDPVEVTTKDKIAAFDPSAPSQVLGAFDPDTKLTVIEKVTTTEIPMYRVKFTNASS